MADTAYLTHIFEYLTTTLSPHGITVWQDEREKSE